MPFSNHRFRLEHQQHCRRLDPCYSPSLTIAAPALSRLVSGEIGERKSGHPRRDLGLGNAGGSSRRLEAPPPSNPRPRRRSHVRSAL